jgi:para-nitrobenzyl esterase
MREHWLAFVRDGAPGPDWPAFALDERAVRVFHPAGDRTEHDPSRTRRLAWAGRDVLPRS